MADITNIHQITKKKDLETLIEKERTYPNKYELFGFNTTDSPSDKEIDKRVNKIRNQITKIVQEKGFDVSNIELVLMENYNNAAHNLKYYVKNSGVKDIYLNSIKTDTKSKPSLFLEESQKAKAREQESQPPVSSSVPPVSSSTAPLAPVSSSVSSSSSSSSSPVPSSSSSSAVPIPNIPLIAADTASSDSVSSTPLSSPLAPQLDPEPEPQPEPEQAEQFYNELPEKDKLYIGTAERALEPYNKPYLKFYSDRENIKNAQKSDTTSISQVENAYKILLHYNEQYNDFLSQLAAATTATTTSTIPAIIPAATTATNLATNTDSAAINLATNSDSAQPVENSTTATNPSATNLATTNSATNSAATNSATTNPRDVANGKKTASTTQTPPKQKISLFSPDEMRSSNSSAKGSSQKSKKSDVPIPNQLNITLQTNIPGFQKVTFKPSMVMKNAGKDDSEVRFYPLVKLNKATIDKIPEQVRVREFFNKGLFQSLLNYTNQTPVESLALAKRFGYIDNNIQLTLNTIFANGTIITIGGKPYTIADVRWSSGDWKVDTKMRKRDIDPNRITDPYLYAQLMKEGISTGEEQLRKLEQSAPEVIYGSNFTGQKNAVATGPETTTPTTATTATTTPLSATSSTTSSTTTPATTPTTTASATTLATSPSKNISPAALKKDCKSDPNTKLTPNSNPNVTLNFRNFFKKNDWKRILNILYNNSEQVKQAINNLLKNSSSTDSANYETNTTISESAFTQLINGIHINANAGAGDCFFLAIKDAINYHNCTHPDDRILKSGGKGNQLFTQEDIRQFVVDFFNDNLKSDPTYYTNLNAPLELGATNLNQQFQDTLATKGLDIDAMTPSDYRGEAAFIYDGSPDSLFVKFPKDKSNGINPFTPITDLDEARAYLLSPAYWANEMAYAAVAKYLKLNVCIIENYGTNNLKIPLLGVEQTTSEYNDWDKYVFLYNSASHFELLSFTNFEIDSTNPGRRTPISNEITIFNRDVPEIVPPYFIIFLLFFSKYLTLTDEQQQHFCLLQDLMDTFKECYDNFLNIADDQYRKNNNTGINLDLLVEFFDNLFKLFPAEAKVLNDSGYDANPKNPNHWKDGGWNQFAVNKYKFIKAPRKSNVKQGNDTLLPSFKRVSTRTRKEPTRYGTYSQNETTHQNSKSKSKSKSNKKTIKGGALTYPNRMYPNRMYPYQRYQSPYRMLQPEDQYDPSKLAYSITIALELYPGTNVTKEQLNSLKCNSKWEAIRKAWAEFTGKPYIIMPNYKLVQESSRNQPQQSRYNTTQRYQPKPQQSRYNTTQRYQPQPQQSRYNTTQTYQPQPQSQSQSQPNNTTKRYQGGRKIINDKKRNKTIRA
jgi:hypothetical protein